MPGTASPGQSPGQPGREAAPGAPATPETSQVRPESASSGSLPGGRPVRVRRRLVAGVAAVSLTVVAAGTPAVLAASADLNDSQRLVTLAELNRQAVTLAHSLADERDDLTAYIAAGRDGQEGDRQQHRRVSQSRSARVDRQIDEIRPGVAAEHGELARDLGRVPSIRRTALSGKGSALEAHRAYTRIVEALHALADELAEQTPPRAADAVRAPAALGLAVEQAAASRGLLTAALSLPLLEDDGPAFDPVTGLPLEDTGNDRNDKAAKATEAARDALSGAAQQARVRELAALADFGQAARPEARERFASTVSGPEVKTAEEYLARLTDRPELSDSDLELAKDAGDRDKVESALSARIEQMRGVESALATAQVERIGQLRDDDVTALELRIALLGGCLLIAVGISAAVARTLTRPLAVLRIGAARLAAAPAPESEEPVRFTGRNDEFAQVVRSLNTLHGKLADLAARTVRLDSSREDLTEARGQLSAQRTELRTRTAELTAELERLRELVNHTFVNLSLRTLGLVERQLGVIEKLEQREQDTERLATLFKLDHMATVMRRHSENLLVLAGAEHGNAHPGPVPLVDVMRAAVSEIERYERVTIRSLPPHTQVAGFAADDLSHLVAELLENATSFSPPDAQVQLSGWLLESGEVMLSIQDAGIGITPERLAELNARLEADDPRATAAGDGEGLGLRVAALLARRHGVRVELREQKQGGTTAVVVLPEAVLPTAPPTAAPQSAPVPGAAPTLNLPGSVAEANSNALPARRTEVPRPASEPEPEAAEGSAETTLRFRLPRPPSEPDTHDRADHVADEAPDMDAPTAADGPDDADDAREPVTDKGLPKRTPKLVTQPAAPRGPGGSVDAEELRRRLGGFQQGAKEGRRDVAAELSAVEDLYESRHRIDQHQTEEEHKPGGPPRRRHDVDRDRHIRAEQ
ncbi:nitrate- and nitrite sensing domain-containing protein [Streptomyces sp. SCSIO 30461]|uniref:sensor histidine kinase n=1 Tax=Streptomyces sp. SCSIO 30461 TaxID=3118085 RepID=UPI0030CDCFB0